jgi:hypothetical protein
MYRLYESISKQLKGKYKEIYQWAYYNDLYDDEGNNNLFTLTGIEDEDLNNKEYLGFLKKNMGKIVAYGYDTISILKDYISNYYEKNKSLYRLSQLDILALRDKYTYSGATNLFKLDDYTKYGSNLIVTNGEYNLYEIWDIGLTLETSKHTGWCTKRENWCEYYLSDSSPGDYYQNLLLLTNNKDQKLALIHFDTGQLKDVNNNHAPQYLEILRDLWEDFKDYEYMLKFEEDNTPRLRESEDLDFSDEDLENLNVISFDEDDISIKTDRFLIVRLTERNYKYIEDLQDLDYREIIMNELYVILNSKSYNFIGFLDKMGVYTDSPYLRITFSKDVSRFDFMKDGDFHFILSKFSKLYNLSGTLVIGKFDPYWKKYV